MTRILFVAAYVVISIRYGAWKRWKEYYSTFLYAIIGDLGYNLLFYEKSLWEYKNLVSHIFSDLLIAFIVFPCAITLFLTNYPVKRKRALYILIWAGIHTALEYISCRLGNFVHYNNWNILWSMALYCIAFVLIRVHSVKPLLAWPISIVMAYSTMFFFHVPLGGMK